MEPDKALNEALLRSHSSTEKANQSQHQLYNLAASGEKKEGRQPDAPHAELNESPKNLMKSYQTLRQLDEELAEKMPEDVKKQDSNEGKPAN